MQATGFFGFAIVVGVIMVVVFGAAWFIAVPVVVLLFLIPMGFAGAAAKRRDQRLTPAGDGVPTSREASYDPVQDPSERAVDR